MGGNHPGGNFPQGQLSGGGSLLGGELFGHCSNYKPIPLLSNIVKILRKLMLNRLMIDCGIMKQDE